LGFLAGTRNAGLIGWVHRIGPKVPTHFRRLTDLSASEGLIPGAVAKHAVSEPLLERVSIIWILLTVLALVCWSISLFFFFKSEAIDLTAYAAYGSDVDVID
jgi:hypothetical protein